MLKAISIYLSANDITSAVLNQPCGLKCVITKALEGLSHAGLTDPSNQEQGLCLHLCYISQTMAYVLGVQMIAMNLSMRKALVVVVVMSGL
jgi:hypothetical protein